VSGKKILVGTAKDSLVRRLTGLVSSRVIRDYDEFCEGKPARRALLSYLVLPLLPPPVLRDRVKFSNRGIAQEIPRVLNELGYSVDIVNYDNRSWLPDRNYDLFIGHGGINFEPISQRLPASTIRVYFATGIYWREWNAKNKRRAEEMVSRRGVPLSSYRAIENEEEYALNNSDGIICLGNGAAVQTYGRFPHVIGINNAIFPVDWEGWRGKDFEGGRKHFLFFSGRGNVHKGLDLLLEAFAGTDLHLHVCQHLEPDFADVYRQELTGHPNIHVYGFIPMRSQKFTALATQCDWVISPTCAEGQPGAVLECMAHGLIPILSEEANIDIGTWGIPLPDCRIDTLRSTGLRASVMEMELIRQMTTEAVDVARTQYSADNFYKNIRKAVAGMTLSFQRQ
jgi:glycosyltransferase involved in cell wall biosynthesis